MVHLHKLLLRSASWPKVASGELSWLEKLLSVTLGRVASQRLSTHSRPATTHGSVSGLSGPPALKQPYD